MAACLAVYLAFALPKQIPARNLTVAMSSEQIERGRYLAEHVILCSDCHSKRDWSKYGAPVISPMGAGAQCITPETRGVGRMMPKHNFQRVFMAPNAEFPGTLCIRNMTPDPETGIGDWTDGEIMRAVREGVGREGYGLFPIMPYFIFRRIKDDDAHALVAYMRSLPPVRTGPIARDIEFPMNLIVQLGPQPLRRIINAPDAENSIRYGAYLALIGRCDFCHTPRRAQGREGEAGMQFAGGVPFRRGEDVVYSSNLSPHEDGLKDWTREEFIARFKQHAETRDVLAGEYTPMNWNAYAGMTEADLGSIYDYLRIVPAVENGYYKPGLR